MTIGLGIQGLIVFEWKMCITHWTDFTELISMTYEREIKIKSFCLLKLKPTER